MSQTPVGQAASQPGSDGGQAASPEPTGEVDADLVVPAGPDRRDRRVAGLVLAACLMFLAVLPFVDVSVPVLLPGPVSSPGSMQILGIGLVFAGLAVSYDLLFGYTGLLSFGHALYFALGVYGTNLTMHRLGLPYVLAALVTVVVVATVAAALGALALRARGVAFAMVTLAYAEVFSILILADPLRMSGGEEGLALASDQVPDLLTGVVNSHRRYWLALVFLVATYGIARAATSSLAGRVWQAVRENEDRVELLGLKPFGFKLLAFTLGCTLAAVGGSVYLLMVRGATPHVASANFTLALLVMVVLGGAGRLWGAAVGGLVYGLLDLRLGALGTSGALDGLPHWAQRILSEPLFVLGTLFVLLMVFAPGGIAGVLTRLWPGRTAEGQR